MTRNTRFWTPFWKVSVRIRGVFVIVRKSHFSVYDPQTRFFEPIYSNETRKNLCAKKVFFAKKRFFSVFLRNMFFLG